MSRRRRYARQGASRFIATVRGSGSGGGIIVPPPVLTLVAAALTALDITVTGTTSGDVSAGVYGIEFSINTIPNPPATPYQWAINTAGAVSSQSLVLTLADWGILLGDVVYARAYYNLLDPVDSDISLRVYGTPVLIILTSFGGLLIGQQ